MMEFIEGKLEEFETEAARPMSQRFGKMAIVGITGLLATVVAESLFEKWVAKRQPTEIEPIIE